MKMYLRRNTRQRAVLYSEQAWSVIDFDTGALIVGESSYTAG